MDEIVKIVLTALDTLVPPMYQIFPKSAPWCPMGHSIFLPNLVVIALKMFPSIGLNAVAAQPPFRPGDPALCESHPLVTP